jgi:RES domain-containing protein
MIAYRLASYDTPLRAIASRLAGRFNRADESSPTQYLCTHPVGPFAELMRGHGLRGIEQLLEVRARSWAVRVPADDLPQITFDNASEFGVAPDDLVSDDFEGCQALAARLRDELPGAIVPSAALPGTENVVLFGPRVAAPYLVEPVSSVDLPAGIAAEGGRPVSSLLSIVRFRGKPHAALEAWESGETFEFVEPDWALSLHAPP